MSFPKLSLGISPKLSLGKKTHGHMNDRLIEELFGSRAKARVLKLFAHNPQAAFSVSDVARKIRVDRALCRSAVLRLVRLNILQRHDIKNKKKENKKEQK